MTKSIRKLKSPKVVPMRPTMPNLTPNPVSELCSKMHRIRHELNAMGYNETEKFPHVFSKKAKRHLEKCIDSYYLFLNEIKRAVDLGDYT